MIEKNGNNSDKHHGVIYILFKIAPREKKFNRKKIQKWCILSFQDAILKVSQKLQFYQF